jgi:hypothetical protein
MAKKYRDMEVSGKEIEFVGDTFKTNSRMLTGIFKISIKMLPWSNAGMDNPRTAAAFHPVRVRF